MRKTILKTNYPLRTICWYKNGIIDWNSAGLYYSLDGNQKNYGNYHFGFVCDGSITSENEQYAFIYQKTGTKGLLLKNGNLLREINRIYYQSSVYEYPVAFWEYHNITYLIHCPLEYNRIDIEEVETGKIISTVENRKLVDIFYSRFEIRNNFLISKGWVWHPVDVLHFFNLEECLKNPNLLDKGNEMNNCSTEIASASFIDNYRIMVCTSGEEEWNEDKNDLPPNHIGIYNLNYEKIEHTIKPEIQCGNIFAIDEYTCLDLFDFPKLIDLRTGKIISECKTINSGKQASSIIHHLENLPKVSFDQKNKQIAITSGDEIIVFSIE